MSSSLVMKKLFCLQLELCKASLLQLQAAWERSVSPVSCLGNRHTVMVLFGHFPPWFGLVPPSHPSQFLLGKGVLVALFSDSPSVPGREVFYYEVLFKHETESRFKNPQHPEGGNRDALGELDSLWVSSVCSAPRDTPMHQPQTSIQIGNSSFNSPKPLS